MAKRRPPPSGLPRAQTRAGSRWGWLRSPSTFIGIFLGLQLLLPLSYYLVRGDRHDERFAWRMFSPERMTRCQPRFLLGDDRTPVRLEKEFHEAWGEIAKRGRLVVVERMALELCKRNPDQPVRVELVCREVGTKDPIELTEGWDVCTMGKLK
jgi:hypothetical protein